MTPAGEFEKHWRSLAGCTIAASVGTIGLNAYTSGAFLPELVAKAGYSREQLSFATLLLSGTVADKGGAPCPTCGSTRSRG